jgi:hypothetical protein
VLLQPAQPGAYVGRDLLPQVAHAQRAAREHADERPEQEYEGDGSGHSASPSDDIIHWYLLFGTFQTGDSIGL